MELNLVTDIYNPRDDGLNNTTHDFEIKAKKN